MAKKLLATTLALMMILSIFFSMTVTSFAASNDIMDYVKYTVDDYHALIEDCDKSISGNYVIPEEIEGKNVVIGDNAFKDCTSLTGITIPDSVLWIGVDAFVNTAIYNNKSNWTNDVLYIGNHLVNATNTVSGVYTVKAGTKTIAAEAFKGCTELTGINIPDSVNVINDGAFADCTALATINITSNTEVIGAFAFANTAYYNNVSSWTDGVLYIGRHLIRAKTDISGSYAVRSSTLTISGEAFADCVFLESIDIPADVYAVDDDTFNNCVSLKSINVNENNQYFSSINGVMFDKYRTKLIKYPAAAEATAYSIPVGIVSIERNAFSDNKALESISVPNGAEIVAIGAFRNCSALKSIELPDSVDFVGTCAFMDCKSLESVKLPDTLADICGWTFAGCTALSSVNFPASLETVGTQAFADTALESVELPFGVKTVDDLAFTECRSLKAVVIPNTVENLGEWVFLFCESLEDVTLSSGMEIIPDGAFCNCSSLKTIMIPDSIRAINYYAFESTGLKEVVIPETVRYIGEFAFHNCADMKKTVVYARDCEIYDEWDSIAYDGVVYGYLGSTAQSYAEKYNMEFIALDGEANCSCSCHKSGITNFFWKISNFFHKLFKMEKYRYCECGRDHWAK